MAQIDNRYAQDASARAPMLRLTRVSAPTCCSVYNYMAAGIALTGIVAYIIFTYAVTTDPALAAQSAAGQLALHRGMYLTQFG